VLLEPLAEAERQIGRSELDGFTFLVQAGFKQPRKRLANSLADGLQVPKQQAVERLARAGIDPARRPGELGIDDWVRLFRTQ
jgi:16S rRNA A1518/A1519 N6-dimethyltransferase RsmA/KsgA/DIM1 with predicted DNA glycosylase/AP lyase activity